MEFNMTEKAASFYAAEIPQAARTGLWLYVRVGGIGSGGFSAGLLPGVPDTAYYVKKAPGLDLYITEADAWYFDGMTVDFDEDIGDIVFRHDAISDPSYPDRDLS
ncbi:iron-sulfur cluster biosynthesis family protein [Alkalicoccus chagannorensis]|uniref:iron-sulfur cluster biosynthesis family protein n=1 Tax=Alkalicoccus chagannorensis TaxID=427072 RepID=UPI000412AEEB|nr:iron-sulfur cluster biosynthesis family protein [Alkalicoccus chagannorensis]